jgi:potassium efflux system protein
MNKEEVMVQHTWKEIAQMIFDILNYPLFNLDAIPFSLGKLITGIFLLMLGYAFSRRASGEVDRRVLTRMNMDESLRYTMRRLLFYFFVCITTLFSLHMLAVPVTIFTVIGGALAVGVGFGSQNLVNNFISGVLVMVERPIRVGDYIEVDGVSGQIENVGIRSTILRAGMNALTIIPNTVFIEKKLTNWTMSEKIASAVRVRVAFGTDTKLFSELCLSAVKEHPSILKEPAPSVTFVDFGESALVFDIGYNIQASDFPNKGAIDSAVRMRLNDLFRQNKIHIPYPQRELHMPGGGGFRGSGLDSQVSGSV